MSHVYLAPQLSIDSACNEKRIISKNRANVRTTRSYLLGFNNKEVKLEPMFQSENESNDEDYTRSPVLLDLDENSKQQQQRKIANREINSPNSASVIDQHLQDQVFVSGTWERFSLYIYKRQNCILRTNRLLRRWEKNSKVETYIESIQFYSQEDSLENFPLLSLEHPLAS